METMAATNNGGGAGESRYGGGKMMMREHQQQQPQQGCAHYFQMPLHYPRYSKEDYEAMPEWQLDRLLSEYGLPVTGTLQQKRSYAMGAFLWGGGGAGHY